MKFCNNHTKKQEQEQEKSYDISWMHNKRTTSFLFVFFFGVIIIITIIIWAMVHIVMNFKTTITVLLWYIHKIGCSASYYHYYSEWIWDILYNTQKNQSVRIPSWRDNFPLVITFPLLLLSTVVVFIRYCHRTFNRIYHFLCVCVCVI